MGEDTSGDPRGAYGGKRRAQRRGGNRRAEKGMLDDGLVVSLMVALTEVEEKEDMKTRPRRINMRHIRMRQLMWKVEVLTWIAASIGRILLAC